MTTGTPRVPSSDQTHASIVRSPDRLKEDGGEGGNLGPRDVDVRREGEWGTGIVTATETIGAAPWLASARANRRVRSQLVGALLALAMLVPLLLLRPGQTARSGTSNELAQRTALDAYVVQIRPLAKEGGRVVQLGLKAGVTDIGQGRFPDDELITMASGWVAELERIRDSFADAAAPAFAADAQAIYGKALNGYVAAAKTLLAAARAHGDQRTQLVADAVSLGERTDAVYDRADALIEQHRARLGLPDPAATKPPTTKDR